jgi:uncharacterized protein (DUF1800 family)
MATMSRTLRNWTVGAAAILALALSGGARASDISAEQVALLERLTWGINGTTVAQFQRLGMDRWLDEQLAAGGEAILPRIAQDQIEAMSALKAPLLEMVIAKDAEIRAANKLEDPDRKAEARTAYHRSLTDVVRQAAAREILRALYSPRQIHERLTWFWFNHFNVHQSKSNIRLLVGDYVERAIRPNALGRFCELLSATVHHPAMLRYLDNALNAVGRINENYAREVMELHTMGAGSGYTQRDVEELARVMTGAGISHRLDTPRLRPEQRALYRRDGLFEFHPARHDASDKRFLGHEIRGRGLAQVEEAVGILCRHPATAAYISKKLATYFIGDSPPESLVSQMTETFKNSGGDVSAVMRTMIRAPQFTETLKAGGKFKDAIHYVLSAIRLAYDGKIVRNTLPIQSFCNRLGQGLFNRSSPDGYSPLAADWNGPGQMMLRFEVARQIGSGAGNMFKPDQPDAVAEPAFPLLQNELYFRVLRRHLSPTTLAALDQAISPQDWNVLFLSSPEFMRGLAGRSP